VSPYLVRLITTFDAGRMIEMRVYSLRVVNLTVALLAPHIAITRLRSEPR
jgi:hypothetical protein